MAEIQNTKQLVFDLNLRFRYCNLEFIWPNFKIRWCLQFGVSGLSGSDNCSSAFGIDNFSAGATFTERSLRKKHRSLSTSNDGNEAHPVPHFEPILYRTRLSVDGQDATSERSISKRV